MLDIPKDKSYPWDAGQCDDCGGIGCPTCGDKGWLEKTNPKARKCAWAGCKKVLPSYHIAVYCSNRSAN
ncbi:MAG: hypothetical protein UU27_C0013G0001, partial [Parcubacteria group bacterium GW2011_GWD1_40_9]